MLLIHIIQEEIVESQLCHALNKADQCFLA